MATTDYESVLQQARRLTPAEQLRLSEELADMNAGLGARFVAHLTTLPLDETDRADFEAMKQAIEEGCERIDTSTW